MLVLLAALAVLHGTVTIGPTSPVCRAGVPCSKPAAHVVLTFTHDGRSLRATTDGAGRYRLALAAGVWTVRASAGRRIEPLTVRIPRLGTVTRNFAIDTGIR